MRWCHCKWRNCWESSFGQTRWYFFQWCHGGSNFAHCFLILNIVMPEHHK